MSATEMQNFVSSFIKDVRETGAFRDGSADSIINAMQDTREKTEEGPNGTNVAGGFDIEVVQFLGNVKEKEQFVSGNIAPLTLVKTNTLDEFVSFADVCKNAINVGTFSEKNGENFFQKYEYIDGKGNRVFALEESKDISEGLASDVYHFKEDFNAPSALNFLKQK
jgi:hypothetical protein